MAWSINQQQDKQTEEKELFLVFNSSFEEISLVKLILSTMIDCGQLLSTVVCKSVQSSALVYKHQPPIQLWSCSLCFIISLMMN
jgi:hypothetical protein